MLMTGASVCLCVCSVFVCLTLESVCVCVCVCVCVKCISEYTCWVPMYYFCKEYYTEVEY